jgi:hypothetical protein
MKMSKPTTIAIRIGAWIGTISLFLFAWPFSLPGVILAITRKQNYPRYIGSALALTAVVLMRLKMGGWIVRIGGASAGQWYFEIFLGGVAWAVGAILVALSYLMASIAFRRISHCANLTTP